MQGSKNQNHMLNFIKDNMKPDLLTHLQPSCILLDKSALECNIMYLRQIAGPDVRISSVIKGNAYGHGIDKFLPLAEKFGINHFSVFSADEAFMALSAKKNSDTRIMLMGMIRDNELAWAVENDIEFYVFEKGRLEASVRASKKRGNRAKIHLQIETGMNRLGFRESEVSDILSFISNNKEHLELTGVCTHFAGAESVANHVRVHNQFEIFKRVVENSRKQFGFIPYAHASSSAALLTYPQMRFDMVRVGIAQYGFWPSSETYMHRLKQRENKTEDPLKRVISWKSEVMSTKWVDAGKFIGYGNVFLTNRKTRIATVPIGYTHGFGRNLTNTGYVLIRGVRAQVAGLVNMNMLTVDITDIPGAQKGDEVVIIGNQGDQEISVASFGEMSNNLNYELLTRLPNEIPRIVV